MGRGHGGYTEPQPSYKDSRGQKVIDKGAIFVGERYMDQGYETVFRGRRNDPLYDLTIKTSDDTQFIKNIEVKMVSGDNPSRIATMIKKAQQQIGDGDTVAIYLPNRVNNAANIEFARTGIDEARRKGFVKGPIEVWFGDKTKVDF
ncbi:MAG: hypothetical protein J5654_02155 [Victivallales bacterium]|nr:hypothetical protein [Victivallales bacterium]